MKNNSQMITARQGNRIMILEIFSAAAMFLPQIALQKSYHSGIVVVVMASVDGIERPIRKQNKGGFDNCSSKTAD